MLFDGHMLGMKEVFTHLASLGKLSPQLSKGACRLFSITVLPKKSYMRNYGEVFSKETFMAKQGISNQYTYFDTINGHL